MQYLKLLTLANSCTKSVRPIFVQCVGAAEDIALVVNLAENCIQYLMDVFNVHAVLLNSKNLPEPT